MEIMNKDMDTIITSLVMDVVDLDEKHREVLKGLTTVQANAAEKEFWPRYLFEHDLKIYQKSKEARKHYYKVFSGVMELTVRDVAEAVIEKQGILLNRNTKGRFISCYYEYKGSLPKKERFQNETEKGRIDRGLVTYKGLVVNPNFDIIIKTTDSKHADTLNIGDQIIVNGTFVVELTGYEGDAFILVKQKNLKLSFKLLE